jgi:hypothetical protein
MNTVADFGTLKIDQVIMHRVPRGARKTDAPETIDYSEAPIELSDVDKGFIQLRLREALSGRARPVVEDNDIMSPSPDIIRGLLSGTGDLVADSAALARGLHQLQKWVSPIGLVMVISGLLDSEPSLIVAKMEHEEGMRVQPTATSDGKRTYKAEYLKDLILGEGTQVFKVGVFKQSGAQVGQKLAGEVVDAQQAGAAVAAYFVEFLGCAFTQRADVLTETFFKETQRFIARAAKDDPEKTAEYEIALLSEMQSGGRRIIPETFAQLHLRQEDKDAFLGLIASRGLPGKGFQKNVELVASTIRRLKVQTERGATVLVPPAMYEDGSMTVIQSDNDQSTVTLTDRITGMSGASGPKPAE